MRYAGMKEVEDAGFVILDSYDDGMGGGRTIVYKSTWSGWTTKENGTQFYRDDDARVGSAYHSTHGTSTYNIDPENDTKLVTLIKIGRRTMWEWDQQEKAS